MALSPTLKKTLISSLAITGGAVTVLVLMHLLHYVLPTSQWGIHPRSFEFSGLLLAPLIHGSWAHLWGNVSVLVLVLPLCLLLMRSSLLVALPIIWLVSFVWVWLFGAPATSHVGASGIIYGLVFFAMLVGVFQRSWLTVLASVISVALFSYFIGSLFSLQADVSFAAHFGGAVGGVLAAFVLRKKAKKLSKA